MSHTPGPWRRVIATLRNEFTRGGTLIGTDDMSGTFRKNHICRLFHPNSPFAGTTSLAPPPEQVDGNANLIAAAPDLLEACEACIPLISPGSIAGDLIRDAIAKAKGSGMFPSD